MPTPETFNGTLSPLAAGYFRQLQKGIWDSADELVAARGSDMMPAERAFILANGRREFPELTIARLTEHVRRMLAAFDDNAPGAVTLAAVRALREVVDSASK